LQHNYWKWEEYCKYCAFGLKFADYEKGRAISMTEQIKESKKSDNKPLEMISKMVGEIKYGTVTVVIQDGKVIQIEANEKFRLQ
jgi:hypothetical protein